MTPTTAPLVFLIRPQEMITKVAVQGEPSLFQKKKTNKQTAFSFKVITDPTRQQKLSEYNLFTQE